MMCLLGVRTLKLISTFYIIAKTVKILAKTGLSFFSDSTLNNGVAVIEHIGFSYASV